MEAPVSNEKLFQCSAEVSAAVSDVIGRYDVRHVLAALGARFAEVAGAAMAVGVDRRFVAEILAGTIDCMYTPPSKTPEVIYVDGDQVLGRKQ
jgi:hypothetical protein